MKHLQKFPKNDGDTILLGTIVALGVKTDTGEFFVTFDANGELKTYLVENPKLAQQFVGWFQQTSITYRSGTPVYPNLKRRNDIRLTRAATETRLHINIDGRELDMTISD